VALNPAQIGRRYSPLILLVAAQLVLAAVAPSIPGGNNGTNVAASGGTAGQSGDLGQGTDAGGAAAGANGATAGGSTGGASGGGANGARGAAASAATAGAGAPGGDRSKCDKNGKQIGISVYMPPCSPVWHGGDNGGATMTGVAPDKINYIFYRAQGNAQVNAILAEENLAATDSQFCQAVSAFHDEINKRWEFYGRKMVSLDGPSAGKHNGSSLGGCNFPYFQGQCSLTPPDPPCERAEADLIASMKPAFVIAPIPDPAFYNQLAKDHIIVSGGETEPDSFHTSVAPYYYDVFMQGNRAMRMLAEYYCKKLVGKPVSHAGADVETFNGPTAPPPKRKLAITYPATNGDPTYDVTAKEFIKLVTGGQCGAPSDGVKAYPYQSDITTAQTQATNTVTQMKNDHVTTVVHFGDPIAPVFYTEAAQAQNYHPEILLTGTGLVDYDVLGQLYNGSEWQHAFGPSTLGDPIPFSNTEAVAAYHDAGRSGEPDGTENLNFAYYLEMADAFQMAGPKPTPLALRDGLFNGPPMGGDHISVLQMYGRPDPASPQGDYTGIHDEREVFWCANQTSPINNNRGHYVSVAGGRRLQLGQWDPGDPAVFPNGPC